MRLSSGNFSNDSRSNLNLECWFLWNAEKNSQSEDENQQQTQHGTWHKVNRTQDTAVGDSCSAHHFPIPAPSKLFSNFSKGCCSNISEKDCLFLNMRWLKHLEPSKPSENNLKLNRPKLSIQTILKLSLNS